MKLAVIGVGLIGGSFARAVKANGTFERIVGFDNDSKSLQRALELGVIDEFALSAAQVVLEADLVMIATPVGSIGTILGEITPYISSTAIITDVGSTKGHVIHAAQRELGTAFARFVPGHPIAGSERFGVAYADANLFRDKVFVSVPTHQTRPEALTLVEALWVEVGAHVERMTSEEHDRIFAAVSHLPHLLAFALIHHIATQPDSERKFSMSGAGFRDFTRIAASSPRLWSDVCAANAEAISAELSRYRDLLAEMQTALDTGNGDYLERAFSSNLQMRR